MPSRISVAAHPATRIGAPRYLIVADDVLPVDGDVESPAQVSRKLRRGAVHPARERSRIAYEPCVLYPYAPGVGYPVPRVPGDVCVVRALRAGVLYTIHKRPYPHVVAVK
jgi:hypothetical protein